MRNAATTTSSNLRIHEPSLIATPNGIKLSVGMANGKSRLIFWLRNAAGAQWEAFGCARCAWRWLNLQDQHEYWALRTCLRDPIPGIFEAAVLLDRAVGYHLVGELVEAERLLIATDKDEIRAFTESLWGAATPEQASYIRKREVPNLPSPLPDGLDPKRLVKPNDRELVGAIIERWGRHCVYCGVPLIRSEIPKQLRHHYQNIRIWGRNNRNAEQHAAFQLMWMQFDHVIPHHRGGRTSPENVVVTCAPCNYGKGDCMLEELGLIDPRERIVPSTSWDGLERLLA